MQLYHHTLVQPQTISHTISLHLHPLHPKSLPLHPKQLLTTTTTSLQFHHVNIHQPLLSCQTFHHQQLFSPIVAINSIPYQDQDIRKDLVVVCLGNGRYMVLEWIVESQKCVVVDQNYVFGSAQQNQKSFKRHKVAHMIAVNSEAKLVLMANIEWQINIYSQKMAYNGLKLNSLVCFKASHTSICKQLCSTNNNDTIFLSLRQSVVQNQTHTEIYRIFKNTQTGFEQTNVKVEDNSAHMLIPRKQQGCFITIGTTSLTSYSKNKQSFIKPLPTRPSYHCLYLPRQKQQKQKKQQIYLINQYGQVSIISLEGPHIQNCNIILIQNIAPLVSLCSIASNIHFGLAASQNNYFFTFNAKMKDDIGGKPRSKLNKQEKVLTQPYREIQVLGEMPNNKIFRDMKVVNLQKTANSQIVLSGGYPGGHGFISIIKYGLKVKQCLAIRNSAPTGIWCLKKHIKDRHDSYIVLSLPTRKTSTFLIQGQRLIVTSQLKLDQNQTSLHVVKLFDGSIVQVMASRIRHITREGIVKDIVIKGRIMRGASVGGGKQLVVLLVAGFVQYYQLVSQGQLKLVQDLKLDSQAILLDFAPPQTKSNPQTHPISNFLVIGKNNYCVALYSYSQSKLVQVAQKSLKKSIQTVTLLNSNQGLCQVVIGTTFGRLIRLRLMRDYQIQTLSQDQVNQKPVKFSKIQVGNKYNILRTSPDPSMTYSIQKTQKQCRLPILNMDIFCQVSLQSIPQTIILTYQDAFLRFISISGFTNLMQQQHKPLKYPGKKILAMQDCLGILMQGSKQNQGRRELVCQFTNYYQNKFTMDNIVDFVPHQKCFSMCYVPLDQKQGFLCLGCAHGYESHPKISYSNAFIRVYRYVMAGKQMTLKFCYVFKVQDIPSAMEAYLDKLIVGVGKKLVLFDILNSKLILRASREGLSSMVQSISVEGEKIIISQVMNSFTIFTLNLPQKTFSYIGSDILPRYTTAATLLDGQNGVMAGGDKFGNFYISKFTQKIKNQFQQGGSKIQYCQFTDNNKMQFMANYNIGQIVTAIQRGKLDQDKSDAVIYCTIDGRIGMFYPFDGQQDHILSKVRKLEQAMRGSHLPGAVNHRQFRSFYSPVKGVVDGDICRMFQRLGEGQRSRVAGVVGMSEREIEELVKQMDSRFL